MSIIDVIERARREPPYVAPDSLFPENPAVCCVFDPIPWDRHELELVYGFDIPPNLAEFWDMCSGMKLYCDDLWLPWGLVVYSPTDPDFFEQNNRYHRMKKDWMLPGDLIFAKFLGIAEQALIRCDKSAPDYQSIIIVPEMDPRSDWKTAAVSLEEFLIKYMDAHGERYWTYHSQKKLAAKAAEDLFHTKQED